MQQAATAYGPAVIKELLNEAIETGHGQEVRHNIARHFFSSVNRTAAVSSSVGDNSQSMDEDSVCSGLKQSSGAAAAVCATTADDLVEGNSLSYVHGTVFLPASQH